MGKWYGVGTCGRDNDAKGLVVEEFIVDKGLVCNNNGKGTRCNNGQTLKV